MTADTLRVAVIIGSTREGRRGPVVAGWFVEELERRSDVHVDVVDLAAAELPARLPTTPDAAMSAFADRVGRADAFVVVTPEYNHGYPASLKAAIDCAREEWYAKPVAFVAYGGAAAGVRAVEQLRQVFAGLRAVTMYETVSIPNVWDAFDAEGRPVDGGSLVVAAKTMVDELVWWADTLRAGRRARPLAA
jgi:NAD(P)H-dependent FMN reductase